MREIFFKFYITFLSEKSFPKYTRKTDSHLTIVFEAFFFSHHLLYRYCHEKTSYMSNYAFFILMHKWIDRGQIHHFEKFQYYTSSDEIRITHRGVFIISAFALYRPIHAIK